MLNFGVCESVDQFRERTSEVRKDEHIVPRLNFRTYVANDSRQLSFAIEPDFVVGKRHKEVSKAGVGCRVSGIGYRV